jgi:hypothetical protein
MSTKFVRFVAVLAVIASIVGNSGVARADRGGALPNVGSQNLELPRTPEVQPLNITPANSLGVQFVHVATAANIYASYTTVIDHPLTNGNPNAIILVTPNWNPGGAGGINDPHPIGVIYSSGKWAIFNQDSAAMPVGAAFNVIIPTAGAGVFVHTVTTSNVSGNSTDMDNPLTNANPNAFVIVTPNYNPGGACGCVGANFPIGVLYDAFHNKWGIFTQNGAAMPLNAAFNVFVLPAGVGVFVHTATVANINGAVTVIDNPLTNGNPNALVFVTQNWNPGGGLTGTDDNHSIEVYYDGIQLAIFNQDGAAMPVNAAFNVLVLVPESDIFVHTATVGIAPYTIIDNALTNDHPNAIVFVTQNYNPGGVGGTGNNENFGMYYAAGSMRIFNQTSTNLLVGAAFNVLVPNPDARVFLHIATVANILSHSTIIDYPLTNGHPDAIILVTLNWNPGGVGGIYDDSPIGVFYDGSQWRIFNQNGSAMSVNAAFNVFVPTAGTDVFVHTATVGNTFYGYTIIDNAQANGNPNAIVIVTPNWNPGGVGGTNENHPIGVWYSGNRWTIFNQDGVAMPVGAAFNVYVFANYKLNLPLVVR